MSKTNIFLLVTILIILIGGGVAAYFIISPKEVTLPRAATDNSNLNLQKESLSVDRNYSDTAGFSFGYPSAFTVKDVTPDNDNYYSRVEIVGSLGKLTLNVVDTTYKTLGEWQSLNKDASLVGATTMAGVKANQYKKGNTLLTVAIDQSILYTLENTSDNALLDEVHNLIISTFKFDDQETATSQTGAGSSPNVEYEEEEVVE